MDGQPARIIRVVLVDDDPSVRHGLRLIIRAEPDLAVVGEAADGKEALAVVEDARPDVVLTDLRMPVMGGIETTWRLRHGWPGLRVIVLSVYADEVERAIAAGAERFMLKDSSAADILCAIRTPPVGIPR